MVAVFIAGRTNVAELANYLKQVTFESLGAIGRQGRLDMLHQPDLPSSPQANPLLMNSIVDYSDDSEADDLDLPIIKPVVSRRSVAGCTNGLSSGDANPQIVSYEDSSSSVTLRVALMVFHQVMQTLR